MEVETLKLLLPFNLHPEVKMQHAGGLLNEEQKWLMASNIPFLQSCLLKKNNNIYILLFIYVYIYIYSFIFRGDQLLAACFESFTLTVFPKGSFLLQAGAMPEQEGFSCQLGFV